MDQVLHIMGMKPKVQTGSPAVGALDDEASSFGLVEVFMAIGCKWEVLRVEAPGKWERLDSVLHEGSQNHKDIL